MIPNRTWSHDGSNEGRKAADSKSVRSANGRMIKPGIFAMSSRFEKIEVSAETGRLIRQEAKKRGVSIDKYLRALVEKSSASSETELSEAEVDDILDELASMGKDLPPLPEDFSREDIYSEGN
jgi:hypothetical protein